MLIWFRIKTILFWLPILAFGIIGCYNMLEQDNLSGAIQLALLFFGSIIGFPIVMGMPKAALTCSLWQDTLTLNFMFNSRTINMADIDTYYYTPPRGAIVKGGVSVADGAIGIRIKGEKRIVVIEALRVEPALYRRLKHFPRLDPKPNPLWPKNWFARIYITALLLLLANLTVFHRLLESKRPPW